MEDEVDGLGQRCFWAQRASELTADTQAALLRWLGMLCRHFAAASLAVPLERSFDAARMLVFGSLSALVDVVLRMPASDAPTALSLHFGGHVLGTAGEFALDMRQLEAESGRGQLIQPRFAAARTMTLDYFRAVGRRVPPERCRSPQCPEPPSASQPALMSPDCLSSSMWPASISPDQP